MVILGVFLSLNTQGHAEHLMHCMYIRTRVFVGYAMATVVPEFMVLSHAVCFAKHPTKRKGLLCTATRLQLLDMVATGSKLVQALLARIKYTGIHTPKQVTRIAA